MLSFSFFTETGETEDSTIAGRNFPVKVGSVGLKARLKSNERLNFYSRFGIGYSPKQSVSAFNFNVRDQCCNITRSWCFWRI